MPTAKSAHAAALAEHRAAILAEHTSAAFLEHAHTFAADVEEGMG